MAKQTSRNVTKKTPAGFELVQLVGGWVRGCVACAAASIPPRRDLSNWNALSLRFGAVVGKGQWQRH